MIGQSARSIRLFLDRYLWHLLPKPLHDRLVEGFLLNHQLHWFSIRQFGNSDRFYNLDSCIPEPVWISAMYLGLTLREMERQGASVWLFVEENENAELNRSLPCRLLYLRRHVCDRWSTGWSSSVRRRRSRSHSSPAERGRQQRPLKLKLGRILRIRSLAWRRQQRFRFHLVGLDILWLWVGRILDDDGDEWPEWVHEFGAQGQEGGFARRCDGSK